jgi:hypothetical protein
LFGLHRFKLHSHLVDRTVKFVWFRQVFGLLRVWFRQVFGILRVWFRQVFGLLRVWFRQVFGLLRVWFRQVLVYSGFGLDRFPLIRNIDKVNVTSKKRRKCLWAMKNVLELGMSFLIYLTITIQCFDTQTSAHVTL